MLSYRPRRNRRRFRAVLAVSTVALLALGAASVGNTAQGPDDKDQATPTTPIKHVIVMIGENRSFDHVFGTYNPKHGEKISNLLTKGIVKADGTPGPNFAAAAQMTVPPQSTYFIGATVKTPYLVLPPPDTTAPASAKLRPHRPSPAYKRSRRLSRRWSRKIRSSSPPAPPACRRRVSTRASRTAPSCRTDRSN